MEVHFGNYFSLCTLYKSSLGKTPCPTKPVLFMSENVSINPILHTWFRGSCFTCDGSPAIQVFPLIFYIGIVEALV
jgi:hypothetical protein